MAVDPTAIVKPLEALASSETIQGALYDAWQAVIGDRIAAYRLKNAAKLQLKAQKHFDQLGLSPDKDRVPERFAITWFEEATKQDEDEIQDLFARLLANAATGDEDALDRRNLEIVSKLTPNDAALFLELGQGEWGARRIGTTLTWEDRGRWIAPTDSKVTMQLAERSFEHLQTIGLLTRITVGHARMNNRSLRTPPTLETQMQYLLYLTEAGKSVYKAVTGLSVQCA
ncbi:hypothetical protein J3454_07365 [Erythrobacter sp. NFXS35]|uniref:Abi-alpha family protein n=1 Tax=Erythrobacter sp. NFXS35 TaxID=2818436 RepID=UPI0032DFC42B